MKRLPGSRSPQSRTPIPRHGLLADAWQRASSRPAMQWYRSIACLLLATIAIKFVIMTATALPDAIQNMAWLGPLHPPARDWRADFPLPHAAAHCMQPDEVPPPPSAVQAISGAPSKELDPLWNSRLMQVMGVLSEASSKRDAWANSTQAAALSERVSHWLSGRSCSQQICNHVLDVPKVAMLFLSKGPLHHEALWRRWFALARDKLPYDGLAAAVCGSPATTDVLLQVVQQVCVSPEGADEIDAQHLFSVYVHLPPSVKGLNATSLFHTRILTARTMTRWGSFELVLAAKLLLREALLEPTNAYFAMVSESDVPLYPPAVVYRQIIAEGRSRIDACGQEDTSAYRWRPVMGRAGVPHSRWRKSWQWFMLTADHAQLVVSDNVVHWAFERFCNPSPDETAREGGFDCYSDEHYIPTLLSVMGRENETSCQRTITNVDWRTGGAHPRAYTQRDISSSRIRSLRQPHKRCGYTTAIRSARASLVDAASIATQPSMHDALCTRPPPAYTVALNARCPLFARKFPNDTASEVLKLFGDCTRRLYILTDECSS